MAKKQEGEEELKQLRTKVQQKKVVIGTDKVVRQLKEGKIGKIFLARNCPDKTRKDISYYAGLMQVPIVDLAMSNEELGVFCKKNFFISVLAAVGE